MIFNKRLSLGLVLSVALSTTACSIPNSSISSNNIGSNKIVQKSFSSKAIMNQISDGFNETAYFLAFPDVASAVVSGSISSCYRHYLDAGKAEGRLTRQVYLDAKQAVIYEGFDPQAYLNTFSDISSLVGANNLHGAYNHYNPYGRNEGRLSNPTYINEKLKANYNEDAYLLAFPDVKEAVRMGQYVNGYEHFIMVGKDQGLLTNASYLSIRNEIANNGYNEQAYLLANSDVAGVVQAGGLANGYQHYNPYGKNEGRLNYPQYQAIRNAYVYEGYNEEAYLAAFPDIASAVKSGAFASGYNHYNPYGKNEARLSRASYVQASKDIIDGYDEKAYLLAYPDIAAVVQAGGFQSGYQHFSLYGKGEGRLSRAVYREILAGTQFVPIRPMNTAASAVATTSATISWNDSLGATSYKIYNGNNLIATVDGNTNSYNVTGLTSGTNYTFSVSANNTRGDSAKSSVMLKTTIASVGTVTATNIETTTGQLRFDTISGATGYRIYNGSTLLFEVNNVDPFIANLGVNLTNLTPGTNYTLTVKSFDASGETNGSNASFLTKPATPSLTPSNITISSFDISWLPVQGTSDPLSNSTYNVYLNNSPLSMGQVATSYSFTGLIAGTPYNIKVGAVNTTGESIKADINVTTVPLNPTNLMVSNIGQTTAALTWSSVMGASAYKVYNGNTFVGTTTNTTYNLNNLTPGTTYTFNVTSVNSGGESTQSPVMFTTAPGAPTGLMTSNITNSSIQLNWTATSGATKYKVYKVVNGMDVLIDDNVTVTSYNFTGLMQNTPYTLKVLASNGTGDSDTSSLTASTLSINFGGGIGKN